jgi:excisionase family DNA binding protein
MNEPSNPFALFFDEVRRIVREEIAASNRNGHDSPLLTPEQLAEKLSVPRSWVYEQSRQGNIPTHRLGKYLRFNLAEVMSHKRNGGPPS